MDTGRADKRGRGNGRAGALDIVCLYKSIVAGKRAYTGRPKSIPMTFIELIAQNLGHGRQSIKALPLQDGRGHDSPLGCLRSRVRVGGLRVAFDVIPAFRNGGRKGFVNGA